MRIHRHLVGVVVGVMTAALVVAAPSTVATEASPGPSPAPAPPTGLAGTGRMLISDGGDLYLADPDGSNPVPLVTGPDHDFGPAFTHDGTKVLFIRGVDGEPVDQLMVDLDGSDLVDLGRNPGQASLSPDDTRMAWCCTDDTIAISTLGGERVPLDLGGVVPIDLVDWRPPVGDELIILAHPDRRAAEMGLYAVNPDGGSVRQIGPLATPTDRGWALFANLRLSPDGSRIAWWNWEQGEDGSTGPFLHQRDVITGADLPVPFALPGGRGVVPMYSPDGTSVVFMGDAPDGSGAAQLYLAPLDGSEPPVPVGPSRDYQLGRGATISPDGTKLLVAVDPRSRWPSVIVDLTGGQPDADLADISDDGGRVWQRVVLP